MYIYGMLRRRENKQQKERLHDYPDYRNADYLLYRPVLGQHDMRDRESAVEESNMRDSERDAHFQGFARLLRADISKLAVSHYEHAGFDYESAVITLIAQRVYDLMYHQVEHVYKQAGNGIFYGEIPIYIAMMPDMTEFPDDKEQA